MENMLRLNGLMAEIKEGMIFNPLNSSWKLDRKDLDVNYILTSSKVEEFQQQWVMVYDDVQGFFVDMLGWERHR